MGNFKGLGDFGALAQCLRPRLHQLLTALRRKFVLGSLVFVAFETEAASTF